ncbi:unnamed protein product, partial [Effrenium voratum]
SVVRTLEEVREVFHASSLGSKGIYNLEKHRNFPSLVDEFLEKSNKIPRQLWTGYSTTGRSWHSGWKNDREEANGERRPSAKPSASQSSSRDWDGGGRRWGHDRDYDTGPGLHSFFSSVLCLYMCLLACFAAFLFAWFLFFCGLFGCVLAWWFGCLSSCLLAWMVVCLLGWLVA